MRIGLSFVQCPECHVMFKVSYSNISDDWHSAVGMSFETEGKYGDENEEHRGEGHNPGRGRGVRLIKQRPDPGLKLLPPGHVAAEVTVLVAEFLGELLFCRFVCLNIKLKEKNNSL